MSFLTLSLISFMALVNTLGDVDAFWFFGFGVSENKKSNIEIRIHRDCDRVRKVIRWGTKLTRRRFFFCKELLLCCCLRFLDGFLCIFWVQWRIRDNWRIREKFSIRKKRRCLVMWGLIQVIWRLLGKKTWQNRKF
jgi:hypothetical protein